MAQQRSFATPATRQSPSECTAEIPYLDDQQVGHLRHIDNLSRQPTNQWNHMSGLFPMQEDYGAYRYQLAYMAYAAALAHVHHLPAAPCVFKDTIERLIGKMLLPEVWLYWRNSSTGKSPFTMSLPPTSMRTDPVAEDNIMYSAYLQTMTLLYTTLFGDRKYEAQDSLKFKFAPILWGNDQHAVYSYDQRTLNERIYWNMVENGYLGVACEPYCVFQICNQVPILGFRLHDRLYGTAVTEEVTAGYLRAWEQFGGSLNSEGHFSTFVVTGTRKLIDTSAAWSDAWCGMLMNMWRPELVREAYERAKRRWLIDEAGGTLSVQVFAHRPGSEIPEGINGELGWFAAWASEMGDLETLHGLLAHADRYMKPTWEAGGLFYPRNDTAFDAEGRLTAVTPTMGNALLQYARLNVNDGLRQLFQSPWDDEQRSRPALVATRGDVDVRRAWFDADAARLLLSTTPRGRTDALELEFAGIWGRGDWSLDAGAGRIASGDSADVKHVRGGLSARREGDRLRVALTAADAVDLEIEWLRA
jgi:hypothetical protein